MTEREVRACWWSSEEKDAILQHSRTIVQRTKLHKKNEAFLAKTLNRAYHKACRVVNGNIATGRRRPLSDCDVAAFCNNDNLMSSKSLRCWAKRCEVRRGLEKHLTTEERQLHASFHRESVLKAASKALIPGSTVDGDDSSSACSVASRLDDELIGLYSMQTSAISRVFARMIGEADASFVKEHIKIGEQF
jgi:hypothetical protein